MKKSHRQQIPQSYILPVKELLFTAILILFAVFESRANDPEFQKARRFNKERDLLLVQFDCKTDVDDLQTAAALVTLLADAEFQT